MLKMHSSERISRLDRVPSGEPVQATGPDNRARGNLARIGRSELADLNLRSAATPPVTGAIRPDTAFDSVFAFFMEGFASYGASLHPTAAFDVKPYLTEEEPVQQRAASSNRPHGFISLAPPSATSALAAKREHGANAGPVACDGPPAPDVARSGRWNWLALFGETIATRWMRWRSERQIKRTIAGLAEFDDQALRGMGIAHRSQIEQVVRYCRDC